MDASLNPGNSGGPVVNEAGEVIGVASGGLIGEDVSNVGFAVPVNEVKALLESKGVSYTAARGGPKLEGPEVARRVVPSVVLLMVTVGQEGGHGKNVSLELRAFSSTRSRCQDEPPEKANASRPLSFEGVNMLVVDEYGKALDVLGDLKVASFLAPFGQSLLVELPFTADKTWKREEATLIGGIGGSSLDRSMGLGRSPRWPFGRSHTPDPLSAQRNYLPGIERSTHELVDGGDTATIKIRYELKTLQQRGEPALLEVVTRGQLLFDKKAGVPTGMEMEGVLGHSDARESQRLPVKISFHKGGYNALAAQRLQA